MCGTCWRSVASTSLIEQCSRGCTPSGRCWPLRDGGTRVASAPAGTSMKPTSGSRGDGRTCTAPSMKPARWSTCSSVSSAIWTAPARSSPRRLPVAGCARRAAHFQTGLHRARGETTKPVERSHVPVKDRLRPMRGLQSIATGQCLLEGIELAHAIRHGHIAFAGPPTAPSSAHVRARTVVATFEHLAQLLRATL